MRRTPRSLGCILMMVLIVPTSWSSDAPIEAARSTSTFNQQWLDAVISIEVGEAGNDPEPIGTGFLVRTARNHVVVVTAKHVVEEFIGSTSRRLGYRLNTTGSKSVVLWEDDLKKQGLGEWHLSSADIACRFVAWPDSAQIVTMTGDNFLPSGTLMAGAPLLVLGFPLGIRSVDHARAIVRHGVVGRSDPDGIVVDAFVFPGNSGGPVVYSPSFKAGHGLSSPLISEEKLIGIVSSFVPYREPAISPQTKRVRVIFEENSGLANVVPVERLIELLAKETVTKQDASLP